MTSTPVDCPLSGEAIRKMRDEYVKDLQATLVNVQRLQGAIALCNRLVLEADAKPIETEEAA